MSLVLITVIYVRKFELNSIAILYNCSTSYKKNCQLVDSLFLIACSQENNVFSPLHFVLKVTLHYPYVTPFDIHSTLELY